MNRQRRGTSKPCPDPPGRELHRKCGRTQIPIQFTARLSSSPSRPPTAEHPALLVSRKGRCQPAALGGFVERFTGRTRPSAAYRLRPPRRPCRRSGARSPRSGRGRCRPCGPVASPAVIPEPQASLAGVGLPELLKESRLRRAALNAGVREEPQEQSTSRKLGHSFFRLSRAPLALSVTLLVAFLTSPLALSVLPSASLRLSPVKLPAASLTAPLTLSAVPEAMNHLQRCS